MDSWVGKICWRKDRLPSPVFLCFPCGSAGKESACNAGDLDLIPGLERSPGEGKVYPIQYSGLEIHGLYSPWGLKESDMTEQLSFAIRRCRKIQTNFVASPIVSLLCTCMLSHCGHAGLCNPINCSLPSSSVHGILQARIVE